jgi:hypothetical protein
VDGKRKRWVDGRRKRWVDGRKKTWVDGRRKRWVDGRQQKSVDGRMGGGRDRLAPLWGSLFQTKKKNYLHINKVGCFKILA